MPIIGNPIYQSAFVVDQFSGNGSTTAFTMSVAPAGVTNVLVAVSGVLQDPSTYGVVGNTITFSAAPPSGTGNISCRYLGVPVTGVTTTAYRTVTEFTATASQTTFTPPSYSVGFINVYLNGVLLGSADYTATNGTTVVLAVGASAGNLLTVESFLISSVANAIANAAGSVGSNNIANGVTINFADGSASTPSITNDGDTNTGIFFPAADTIAFSEGGVESMRIDSSGRVGIGETSPGNTLSIKAAAATVRVQSSTGTNAAWQLFGNTAGNFYIGRDNSAGTDFGAAYGSYLYSEGAYPLVSWVNGAERMRIDSSGRVTMPYQPAFSVKNPGSSVSGVQVFTGVYVNTGSHYNTSNGRFTAPVAGRYYFYFQALANPGNSDVRYLINGGAQSVYAESNETTYKSISFGIIFSLSANDYVQVDFFNGSNYGLDYSNFCGYLLG
jgi:hypothetical protein